MGKKEEISTFQSKLEQVIGVNTIKSVKSIKSIKFRNPWFSDEAKISQNLNIIYTKERKSIRLTRYAQCYLEVVKEHEQIITRAKRNYCKLNDNAGNRRNIWGVFSEMMHGKKSDNKPRITLEVGDGKI